MEEAPAEMIVRSPAVRSLQMLQCNSSGAFHSPILAMLSSIIIGRYAQGCPGDLRPGKSPEQCVAIVQEMLEYNDGPVLITE